MLGVDVGEVGLGLEGHLEDTLAPEAGDMEGMPQQEDAPGPRLGTAGQPYLYATPNSQHGSGCSYSISINP